MDESPTTSDSHVAPFSDEELTALALAADPSAPLRADATAWDFNVGDYATLLPDWYMPRPITAGRRIGLRVAALGVVTVIVVICAFGLCVTSGFVSIA